MERIVGWRTVRAGLGRSLNEYTEDLILSGPLS